MIDWLKGKFGEILMEGNYNGKKWSTYHTAPGSRYLWLDDQKPKQKGEVILCSTSKEPDGVEYKVGEVIVTSPVSEDKKSRLPTSKYKVTRITDDCVIDHSKFGTHSF